MSNKKWETEAYQTEDGETTFIKWGPSNPSDYAELYCVYKFFDTEQEAAKAFLEEVAEHPEARYHRSQYEDALKVTTRTESAYDVLAALIDGKSIEYVYSPHYYVYITFTPEGVATIEDGDREAYTINPITDPCRTSVEDECNVIYTVLDAVQRALQVLPSGNIEQYGGKAGIIKTLYDAECIKRHVAGLS